MTFNQLVVENLEPLLKKNGFLIADTYENFFRYKSPKLEVTVSRNEFDKTNLFEIGKVGDFLYPINDHLIKNAFDLDLGIEKVPKEAFVINIAIFLKNSGLLLLGGDEDKLIKVKNFVEKESKEYTSVILTKQALVAADKAWQNGYYEEFIKIIDKIDNEKVPSSYRLKYGIANRKMS